MNIDHIIDEFERGVKAREAQQAAEAEKRRQQRSMNAEAAEECIRTVVAPILERAAMQIRRRGYACDVEFISRKDAIGGNDREMNTGIRMIVNNVYMPGSRHHLRYEGGFDAPEMFKAEGHNAPEKKSPPMAISRLTGAAIEEDLERFLCQVFSVQ